jgi:hypothetical protein
MFPSLGPEILQPPYNPSQVNTARYWSPEVADCIDTFLERMFRQEIFYEPAFARRCEACDMEYEEDHEECPICGKETREPIKKQEKLAERWLRLVNDNGMNLAQYCRILTDKALTYDDAFILLQNDYDINDEGVILKKELREIWLGSTERIRLIFDEAYRTKGYVRDDRGKLHGFFTCVLHRDMLYPSQGSCSTRGCGLPLHPCVAVGMDTNGQPSKGYLEEEILHWSPRNPTEGYGFSRIATLLTVIFTIAAMDDQQRTVYAYDRHPKGFLTFNCRNPDSLQAQFRKEEAQRGRNPNHIPKFALDSESKSGGAQWVPITPTYQELENIENRKDLYRRIWSSFEVEPIFMADTSAGGGLNNEGRQLTVNLQAVESLEGDWHEVLFPFIEKAIGLTDYRFRFPDPAEQDKQSDAMLKQMHLTMRMMIEQAGGTVEITDEDNWEFQIVDQPDFELMAGGMGGMGGGFGGGGGGMGGGAGGEYSHAMRGQGEDFGEATAKSLETYAKAVAGERAFYSEMMEQLEAMLKEVTDNLELYTTPEQQQAMIDKIVGFAVEKMATGAETDMAEALLKGVAEAGVNPIDLGLDMNAVRALTQDSPVWRSFADMSAEMSNEVGNIVERVFVSPQPVETRKLVRQLSQVVGERRHQLRRIARTETNRVRNTGREIGYNERDPEGEWVFKWVGARDTRTCQAHKRLIRETARTPLPLSDLKLKVAEYGRQQMGPNWEIQDWVIHPNQRGALIRVVL